MPNIKKIDPENVKNSEDLLKHEDAPSFKVDLEPQEVVQEDKFLQDEDTYSKELKKKIENDDVANSQGQQLQAIKSLPEEEKIKNLLLLAQKKGVDVAINTAKKMDDPYILDRLHDELAKGGKYKDFKK